MQQIFHHPNSTKTIYSRVPKPIAKILTNARENSRLYVEKESPHLSVHDIQINAEEIVLKEFTIGLDTARFTLNWDIYDKFSEFERHTIRIRLNQENDQTVTRMMRMHSIGRNIVITEAIWYATYSKIYNNFNR